MVTRVRTQVIVRDGRVNKRMLLSKLAPYANYCVNGSTFGVSCSFRRRLDGHRLKLCA